MQFDGLEFATEEPKRGCGPQAVLLVEDQRVDPVVGKSRPFSEAPHAGLARFNDRHTTGRESGPDASILAQSEAAHASAFQSVLAVPGPPGAIRTAQIHAVIGPQPKAAAIAGDGPNHCAR